LNSMNSMQKNSAMPAGRQGFTIIEVLIAIFIIALGAGGLLTLSSQTIKASSFVNNKLVASYLAQEGVEIVRNIRDTNYLKIRQGDTGVAWDDNIILPGNDCATRCQTDYNDTALAGVGALTPLLRDAATNLYWYDSGTATNFTREIKATLIGTDKIEVVVTVFWTERNNVQHNVVAATELFNWLIL